MMAEQPGSLMDIKVLLDFLNQSDSSPQCHDEQAQITSLQALSTMCTKEVADLMIQCGGLKLIWRLCGKTKHPEVSQFCLYTLTCAAECSEQVRRILSTNRVFMTIKAILEMSNVADRTKVCASYFLIPLVTQRETGQELMRFSGCLHIILQLFASGVQLITRQKLKKESLKYKLWTLSAKALRRAVSMPRHEINQLECLSFVPQMVTILYESRDDKIVLHACQVLGAVLELNSTCQEKAFSSRALEVLILILQSRAPESSEINIQGEIAITMHNLLDEQKEYYERFEKLGGLAILLHLLNRNARSMTVHHANYILTILARCGDFLERSREYLKKHKAAAIIVRLMNSLEGDEYFHKIAAAVLNYCMHGPNGDLGSKKNSDDKTVGENSSDESCISGSTDRSKNKSFHDAYEIRNTEMLNDGGSSIACVLEKQQAQIDLLQKLVMQERDKRIDSEQLLAEMESAHSSSSCGGSILSPYAGRFFSCHLPLSSMQQRRRHPRSSISLPNQPISGSSGFQSFCRSSSQRTLLSNPDTKVPRTRLGKIFSADCHNVRPSASSRVQGAGNKPFRKTRDFECQIKSREDAIDVESYTPCNSVKALLCSRPMEKVPKYYVTEKRKIRQHVFRNRVSNPRLSSMDTAVFGKKKIRPGSKHCDFADDLMSICSEILVDEIRKEKVARRSQYARINSAASSRKVLTDSYSSVSRNASDQGYY